MVSLDDVPAVEKQSVPLIRCISDACITLQLTTDEAALHDDMADVAAAGSHWPTSRLSCFTAAIATILSLTGVAAQEVTQPNPCLRWGAMTTVARGQNADAQHALWIYGGRARTSIGQAADSEQNISINT